VSLHAVELVELPTPAAENLPKFLTDRSVDRLQKLITHPLRFADLHGTGLLPRREARRMTPRRRERRESIVKVSMVLLRHCDLVSLRIGAPRILSDTSETREVTPPGHEALIAECGVSPTSFRRCIAEMKRAGWLTAKQPRYLYESGETGETCYGALRVIYTLTAKFFKALQLDKRLKVERDKASERAGERRRIYAAGLLEARHKAGAARSALLHGRKRAGTAPEGPRRRHRGRRGGERRPPAHRGEAPTQAVPPRLGRRPHRSRGSSPARALLSPRRTLAIT
jgi:hypothetical protein